MLKFKIVVLLNLLLIGISPGMDKKTLMHVVSVPLLDASGIYTSVRMLNTESNNNKASAITSLSLLGVNAGLGTVSLFSNSEKMGWARTTHRIVGFLVTGASLWMAISAGVDDEVKTGDKVVAGGYSALTVVPLIMFSF
jgi:hypothetical protein